MIQGAFLNDKKTYLFMLNYNTKAVTYSNDIINTEIMLQFVTHTQQALTSDGATAHTENFAQKQLGQFWH